jgi:hypothetical protein
MSTTKIWLPNYYMHQVDLSKLDDPRSFDYFYFFNTDMSDCGHTLIGNAKVTCDFFSPAEIQNNAVGALKAEMQEVRAKA